MSGINAAADAAFNNFLIEGRNAMHEVTKMALTEFGSRLVDRSPVGDPSYWKHKPPPGYRPGQFKNNWSLGVDSAPTVTYNWQDPSGQASKLRIAKAIPRWVLGHVYYFANNLPYAQALEEGWSPQVAPGGMVALTELEWQQIVRECEYRYLMGERPTRKADL